MPSEPVSRPGSRDAIRPAAPPPAAANATAWLPFAVLTAGTTLVLIHILLLNGGKLVYTLDDPYIHLAVAENIARGTYGVNLGEPSAPSSSILYPFLFVPFAGFAVMEWIPLVLGFIASAATVALWAKTVGSALVAPGDTRGRLLTTLAVTLLIPATNLIGVMFTGMEHSLQLCVTALLMAGLVVERETGRPPWWIWLAVVLGPLVRYENLALSLPALGYLAVRGERARSLAALAILTLLVGGFSMFLVASGHGILPTSVLLKTDALNSAGGPGTLVARLMDNLFHRQGALLALMGALFAAAAVGSKDRRDRQLAAWAVAAVGLHLVVGRFGWFSRYELYIWSAALLTGIVMLREPLRRMAGSVRLLPLAVGAAGITAAVGFPYLYTTVKTPLASNNIYEQHYQMHRFATRFYDGPIAVTDLGWVSFRNEHYVLDLFGLAHRRAGEERLRGDDSYMDELTREYDIHLAMLYGAWYPDLPPRWRPVAEMRLEKQRITPAGAVVTFFVLEEAAEPRIRNLLRDFGETLPRGVGFSTLP
jgi:hypothetical protein